MCSIVLLQYAPEISAQCKNKKRLDVSEMTNPTLVILGSTQTALAVVRNAYRLKIKPVVFDTTQGIAAKSVHAEVVIVEEQLDTVVLDKLTQTVKNENTYLIATGDDWLEFIVKYRKQLEQTFRQILHSSNDVLSICLEKKRFSTWCRHNQIPTPRFCTAKEIEADKALLKYPLFVRPVKTRHVEKQINIPKALEINDESDLQYWINYYISAGVEPLISESLLNQNLVQFSVAAARVKDQCLSFVAVKKRPFARSCAVGTYVELSENDVVEALGRNVLDSLDYQGIAEVEILHSLDTAKNYVIEVNARPWLQYTLGLAAGYDFLKFLLQPDSIDLSHRKSKGKFWVDFNSDFYTCFAKKGGLVRNRDIGKVEYLRSLIKANVFANFDIKDIRPFLFGLRELVRMITGK